MTRQPAPVAVSAYAIETVMLEADLLTLRLVCSAGFYVRSLAHDLGQRLGTGAHLTTLRRTRSGDATLADAIAVDALGGPGGRAAAEAAIIPLRRMLPALAAVTLTADGVRRAAHGQEIRPADCLEAANLGQPLVRLLDQGGELVAVGEPAGTPGLLHPSVVLV
jgi:tRNA pseudouridine55 synthase